MNINEHRDDYWEDHVFQIIKCEGCESLSFRKLYFDAKMAQEFSSMGEVQELAQQIFPKKTYNIDSKYYVKNLPYLLNKVYEGTIEAYLNNNKILCGAGLRTIIEGICIDKNVTKGNVKNERNEEKTSKSLNGKIQGLAEKGILTKDHAETLHNIRFLGNEAVHRLREPENDELNLAIEIVYLTLKKVYELSVISEELKSKCK
jgi:hypothetical protein